jgi:hypothetical protein
MGVLRRRIGRILPLFLPAFCSMLLLQKNLREFCAKKMAHPGSAYLCAEIA